ncbi:Inositol-1-monophosphatase [Amantichitinum ursilacus]|uniref:Inositol-1-monophosphatase n=1 Tax=Amantichitinum ursilacus TaxID=857265 RepID=A0A0N0XJR5_9NEIS|nr:Inositol-1-monophosphatase [Amantichitinum ursilacus]
MSDLELLNRLCDLAREVAAREVMPRFLNVASGRKQDGSLFTEADLSSQAALVKALPELAPHPVLGEEMTTHEQLDLLNHHRDGLWVVDPIDGTTNFVHGLPFFAISIALMREGKSVLGVVYMPVTDECFSAAAGHGAWLNGKPLPLTSPDIVSGDGIALVDTKYLTGRLPARVVTVAPFSSHRNFGASTVDWCYLAAGKVDMMLHGSQKLWDYAAGALIAEEAGCSLATFHHDNYWEDVQMQRSVIAARTPELFAPWLHWVRSNL